MYICQLCIGLSNDKINICTLVNFTESIKSMILSCATHWSSSYVYYYCSDHFYKYFTNFILNNLCSWFSCVTCQQVPVFSLLLQTCPEWEIVLLLSEYVWCNFEGTSQELQPRARHIHLHPVVGWHGVRLLLRLLHPPPTGGAAPWCALVPAQPQRPRLQPHTGGTPLNTSNTDRIGKWKWKIRRKWTFTSVRHHCSVTVCSYYQFSDSR